MAHVRWLTQEPVVVVCALSLALRWLSLEPVRRLFHEPIRWLFFQPVVGALNSLWGLKGLSWEPISRLAGRPRIASPQPRRRAVELN